jgi:integrase
MHNGQVIRRSTKQSNYKVAVAQEATHKSALSNGDIGIFERTPAPTLSAFAKEFLVWAKAKFQAKPKTLAYYQNSVARLLEHSPLVSLALDDERISERLTGYIAKRQADGLQVSSINHELRCVRRLLHLAVKWGRIESVVPVEMLNGETHREFVLTKEEEAKYLTAAAPLLAAVSTVLVDTGMRPEECYRLRWESIVWVNGRHGTLQITHGKTKAARRLLPMSVRVRAILEARWRDQKEPIEGWVWPAPTKSEHLEPSGLKKQHKKAIKDSKVRPFVLYSLRHTFLTRLGASGIDTWTFARIAGHSNIRMSETYVHPNDDAVLAAMEHPGSPVFGHSAKPEEEVKQLSA